MTIEKTDYRGWANSYRVSNGIVEAIVTSDVGPRIMRFGFVGGQNFFKEFEDQLGRSGEAAWQPRGGHRLWAAPEDRVKTYAPDNGPVQVKIANNVLEAIEPVEALTGLEKRIVVNMSAAGSDVEVIHSIRNAGQAAVTLAPWALTMLAPGGVGIHGFPPRASYEDALDVSSPLIMWAYTNLTDPRWRLLHRYLVLQQDPQNSTPQKMGAFNRRTWGAYLLNRELFVKRSEAPGPPRDYADNGCSFETFTNADFLELETLGRLATLAPGKSAVHMERWSAYRNVFIEQWDDDELDRVLGEIGVA
jgi:hypothetical protein